MNTCKACTVYTFDDHDDDERKLAADERDDFTDIGNFMIFYKSDEYEDYTTKLTRKRMYNTLSNI